MEYAAAKSTMCRQCGRHYAPAATPKPAPKLRLKREPTPGGDPSLLQKFEGFWGRQRSSVVECFDCKAQQEVSSAASSTICPACSTHIDLKDYKITTSFSRSIRTHGEVHITPRGDLSSSTVICRSALIEGKLRGSLHCSDAATIDFRGKIPGRLSASHVLIERKAEVQFFRRIHVKSIEIRGRMSGEIVAEGVVVIHKTGSLDGNVTARAISVEKGGIFSGQLVIGREGLTQGELLPATSSPAPARDPEVPLIVSPHLPATS
ncbi:MAG: polymer-forming cytoskeletal protein [Verrucomicrobiota bacterium]|nr:polymer-forming cytoskeletal protein [Verrucomicrobiota bacterium]